MTLPAWKERVLEEAKEILPLSKDASHDLHHCHRVYANAMSITKAEGLQDEVFDDVLFVAAYLHDIDQTPKDSPLRSRSSRIAAELAAELLRSTDFPRYLIDRVKACIEMHSFSYCQTLSDEEYQEKLTLEARIFQDADRLDALGAPGLARNFYCSGMLGTPSFHGPSLDDKTNNPEHGAVFGHHIEKLRLLPAMMHFKSSNQNAIHRLAYMEEFWRLLAVAGPNHT